MICGRVTTKKQHNWDKCKCSRCGKIRDEQHKWNGCECSHCGKTRDKQHEWNGCKCERCGKTRDENHNFVPVPNKCEEVCTVCGIKSAIQHEFQDGICVRCSIKEADLPWMLFVNDNKASKVLDNALTYMMNFGQASNNSNMIYQCSLVMSKMQHNFSDFTYGDFQLSQACLLGYARDIPTLVIANPQYASRSVELNNDRDYIISTLLPKMNK